MKNLKFCMVVMDWNAEDDAPFVVCVYPLPQVKSKSLFAIDESAIKNEFIESHPEHKKDILHITTVES